MFLSTFYQRKNNCSTLFNIIFITLPYILRISDSKKVYLYNYSEKINRPTSNKPHVSDHTFIEKVGASLYDWDGSALKITVWLVN